MPANGDALVATNFAKRRRALTNRNESQFSSVERPSFQIQ